MRQELRGFGQCISQPFGIQSTLIFLFEYEKIGSLLLFLMVSISILPRTTWFRCWHHTEQPPYSSRQKMGSHHWQATCRNRWRHDLPKRWKCRRCCLCHDCRHIHHVGCTFLGRRNTGLDLQSKHQESNRYQCHGCRPNWSNSRFLQGSRHGLPSSIWSSCRHYPRYSRGNYDHACRVWNA